VPRPPEDHPQPPYRMDMRREREWIEQTDINIQFLGIELFAALCIG
jgi:hypothetical protein